MISAMTMRCRCGCGEVPPIATYTKRRLGYVKGQPRPYIPAHGRASAKGKRGRAWKGGRYIDTQGYVLVYQPDHAAARSNGYVLEHRLVVEGRLGRLLSDDEIVHHANKVKSDNRDENLVLTVIGEHERLHVNDSILNPIAQERKREAIRRLWQDPRHRRKVLRSTKTKTARAKQGASMRRRWQDPAFRARMEHARAAARAAGHRPGRPARPVALP